MVAVEDARTAARRIVEQVLAEHEARAADDVRVLTGAAAAVGSTRTDGGNRDSSARRTARRIVEEVLAEERAREQAVAELAAAPDVEALAPTPDSSDLLTGEVALATDVLAERLFALADETPLGEVSTVPIPDPTPQPVPDPMPQPVPDPTPQPVPDPTPQPVPDPTPQPIPDPSPPQPVPDPDPIPEPVPEPGPFPTPEPVPEPDPFPPDPDPSPGPFPAQPEPRPLSAAAEPSTAARMPAASSALPVPPPTPERRQAEDTARRIVQEVVAAHERAQVERAEAARLEQARLVEEAVLLEEARVGSEDAIEAERARLERRAQAERAILQEARLAAEQSASGPFLHELPHPETPTPVFDGPPPIPDAARRVVFPADPPSAAAAEARHEERTRLLPVGSEPETPPRTGRWLLTTIVGAVALALLLPLAVHALRSLITLG